MITKEAILLYAILAGIFLWEKYDPSYPEQVPSIIYNAQGKLDVLAEMSRDPEKLAPYAAALTLTDASGKTFNKTEARTVLANYMHKELSIYGYYVGNYWKAYDQEVEDMKLYLAYKAAKDYIMEKGKDTWTLEEMKKAVSSSELIDFANDVFTSLILDIVTKIEDMKFGSWKDHTREEILLKSRALGVKWQVYHLLKMDEGDRSYAYENLQHFWDFEQFLPIARMNRTHNYGV